MPRWVKRGKRWVLVGYRKGRKYWRRAPKGVKYASYLVPGLGQVRYGVQGARMFHGARLFRSRKRARSAARYIGREVGRDIAVGGSLATGYYLYRKSRGGRFRQRSSQHVRRTGGPSAQKTRRAQALLRRGSAKRGRVRRKPWCWKHKRRHWCRYTRK